jgi:hypothetical protein
MSPPSSPCPPGTALAVIALFFALGGSAWPSANGHSPPPSSAARRHRARCRVCRGRTGMRTSPTGSRHGAVRPEFSFPARRSRSGAARRDRCVRSSLRRNQRRERSGATVDPRRRQARCRWRVQITMHPAGRDDRSTCRSRSWWSSRAAWAPIAERDSCDQQESCGDRDERNVISVVPCSRPNRGKICVRLLPRRRSPPRTPTRRLRVARRSRIRRHWDLLMPFGRGAESGWSVSRLSVCRGVVYRDAAFFWGRALGGYCTPRVWASEEEDLRGSCRQCCRWPAQASIPSKESGRLALRRWLLSDDLPP